MLAASLATASDWIPLFDGKTLEGWEVIGEGVWTVMSDGTLLGQCDPRKPCLHQSWLYTKKEFGEFDLYLEFWTRLGGNSGVSIRDTSRARWAVGTEWDPNRTPSHIGYEIQISNWLRGSLPHRQHLPACAGQGSGYAERLEHPRDRIAF
jgi:hypothetical protein